MNFIHYQPPMGRSLPDSLSHEAVEPSDPIDNVQKAFTGPELSDKWSSIIPSPDHIKDLDLSGPAIEESLSLCSNIKSNLNGTTQIDGDPLRESSGSLSDNDEENDVCDGQVWGAGATHQGTDTGRVRGASEDSSGCVVKNDDRAIHAKSDSKQKESGERPFKASLSQATSGLGVSAGIGTRTTINAVPSTCVGAHCDPTHASNGSTYETNTRPSDASPNPVASAVEDFTKRTSSTGGPETQRSDATQVDATGEPSHGRDKDNNCKDDVNSRSLIKSRPRSTFQKRPIRRRTKRHRFSVPQSWTDGTETDNGSDTLNSASPKALTIPKPRPISNAISSGLADPARTSCNQSSPMMIIYEQQSWEGMVIEERYMKQKRGRARKQYLIRWKDSWVDYNHRPIPKVLQS